jgi:hypothetical protein
MATYVTLYNFTDQGLKNIKDTLKRTEAAKKAGARQRRWRKSWSTSLSLDLPWR